MADSFHTIAARVMPAVQAAYAGTLLGYDAALGYGMPEYNAAAAAARVAARKIRDAQTRKDAVQLALLICAHLIGTGYTPLIAGREALRQAWLIEAPTHTGRTEVAEVATKHEDLIELETTYNNNRPPLTDAEYATRTRDLLGYALQSLPALEYALVSTFAAVDGFQSSRLPVAAMVRHLMTNAPQVCSELGLTAGLPTGRRAVAFADKVRAALQMAADGYEDTMRHNVWDGRNRAARPAPTLYVLPERAGSPTRVPTYAATPGPLLQTGYVTVPARVAGTMAPEYRANASKEQRAADHAATSDALGSSARPIPGVRPGVAYGLAVAGEGKATRKAVSSKRKRDGGIGSPMC